MGRVELTDEVRIERVKPKRRADLVAAVAVLEEAKRDVEAKQKALGKQIRAAVKAGASYRDLEAVTKVPRATLHTIAYPLGDRPSQAA